MKHFMSIAAVGAATLALAGVASAGHHKRGHAHIRVVVKAHTARVSFDHRGGAFVDAAVAYLGVDKATIVAELKSGQSLAQIATAHGKTVDGLVAALVAPAKLKLDAAVAAGRLTPDRETAIVTRLQAAVTKLVNRAPKTPHTGDLPVRVQISAILKPALAYLGLDFGAVATQLRAGKTLGDIAVAQGKTASGLVDTVVASVKAALDKRVAAGKLTAAAETAFLTQLQTRVTAIVAGS